MPVDDVSKVLHFIADNAPNDKYLVINYFDGIDIFDRPRRKRRAVPPQYLVSLWNQHKSTMRSVHRTNNISKA